MLGALEVGAVQGSVRWILRSVICALMFCACGSGDEQSREPLKPPALHDAGVACDLSTNCGCEGNEVCRLDPKHSGATLCASISKTSVIEYAACKDGAECPVGSSCIDSVCKRHCVAPEDCGWQGARCITLDGNAAQASGVAGYCPRDCDPAAPSIRTEGLNACGANLACAAAGATTDCVPDPGVQGEGAACTPADGCAPGLLCSPEGRCVPWCEIGATNGCGPKLACLPLQPEVRSGTHEWGRCGCEPPGGAVCDPGNGCGCGPGETCGFDGTAIACRPVQASAVAPYARCSDDTTCPALHACIASVCQRTCNTVEDCTWAGATCLPVQTQLGAPIPGFNVCSRNCDPVSPAAPRAEHQACGASEQCFPVDGAGLCFAINVNAPEGSACAAFDDCTAGAFCGLGGYCQRWCEVGTESCGAGRTCTGFDPPLQADAGEYGRCLCAPESGGACDPVSDCGCDPGTTCDYFETSTPEFACRVMPAVPVAPHALCTQDEDCPARQACLGGICKPLCNTVADCAGPGARCEPIASGGEDIPGFNYCTIGCDPLSPASPRPGFEACPLGASCSIGSLGADCFAPAGSASQGGACQSLADCAPGLFCGLAGVCQPLCDLGGDKACSAGTSCEAYDFSLRSGDHQFGRCACTPSDGRTCDPVTNCGCEAGMACELFAGDVFGCRPVPAVPSAPYSRCDDSTCPDGYSCLGSVCRKLCSSVLDCNWDGATCIPETDEQDQPVPGVGFCSRNCDILHPSAAGVGKQPCGAGLQCFPSSDSPDCELAGTGAEGAACTDAVSCAPGLICDPSVALCTRWCNTTQPVCSGLDLCVAIGSDAPASTPDLGLCHTCNDDCGSTNGICEDGSPRSVSSVCARGTDCTDCSAAAQRDAGP